MNTLIYNQGLTLPENECKAGYSPIFIRSNRSDGFGFINAKSAYADSAILGTTGGGSGQTLVKEITEPANHIIAVYCPDGARVYCYNGDYSFIIPIPNISWDGASFAGFTNTHYYFNPLLFSKANILITMSAGYKGGYNGRNIYVPSQYEVYHINRSGMMLLNPTFRWLQKETHIKCTASSLRCEFGRIYSAPRSEKVYVIDGFKGSISAMDPFTSPYYPVLYHNCTLTDLRVHTNLTFYLNNQTLIDDAESLSFYKDILNRINNVTSTRTITLYVKSSIASDIKAITDNAPSNITYITNVTD